MSVFRPKRGRLRLLGFAAVFFTLVAPRLCQSPSAHAQAPVPIFKDLKVLPKDISKPDLKLIMKTQAKSLGVDCDFCHKEPNMEADTPKKTIAREMMLMTAELNKKYRATTNGKVTCFTCHRGEKRAIDKPDQ